MQSPTLRQLEKKLEYTFNIIEKLKGQTQDKELAGTRKERELGEFKSKEEELKKKLVLLQRGSKQGDHEVVRKRRELKRRLEGAVAKLAILEKLVS